MTAADTERARIAAVVADRASQREDGPEADDNGSAFKALAQLARDLGYLGDIRPANVWMRVEDVL